MSTGLPDTGTTSPPFPPNHIIPVRPSLHPYMPVHPRPPAPPQYPPATEPHEIFVHRLKWSILDDPSNAELFSLDAEDKPRWTPLFSEPIADEAATNPPVSRLEICIDCLSGGEQWQDAIPPASGLIENMDGRPITVRQFLEGVRDYAIPLRSILCRICDIWGPEDEASARFFFTSLGVHESDSENGRPDAVASLDVEDDNEEGDNWARQLELMELLYRRHIASK